MYGCTFPADDDSIRSVPRRRASAQYNPYQPNSVARVSPIWVLEALRFDCAVVSGWLNVIGGMSGNIMAVPSLRLVQSAQFGYGSKIEVRLGLLH